MTTGMGDHAVALARLGLSVFPLVPRGKRPAIPKWEPCQKARAPEARLREHWQASPDDNIAVACGPISGIWALDIDGDDGRTSLATLEEKYGALPLSWRVTTGKGFHIYFSLPPGVEIKNSVKKLGPGLDTRADGGYVVGPGSLHETGRRYEWVTGHDPQSGALEEAPGWLIGLLQAEPVEPERADAGGAADGYAETAMEHELAAVLAAGEGARNDTLNRAAFSLGTLIGAGLLDRATVERRLLGAGHARGLEAAEVSATVRSGLVAGIAEPRTVELRVPLGARAHAAGAAWPVPKELPDDLLPVAPFDFDMLPATQAPWVRDIAERVQCPPDYVGVTVMTALGTVLGCKVGIRPQAQTDWTEVPNQWALVVGRPGVLKSPAMEAALAPLKRLAARAIEAHQAEVAGFERDASVAKLRVEAAEKAARAKLARDPGADVAGGLAVEQPEAPTLRRYIANDTSAASLGELHRQTPNGLLVYRDEMVSLLKGLDRDDNADARGFYLTGWNGTASYTFDRIGRGMNLTIPAVCISMLGSTQPGRISEYIRAAVRGGSGDDGLIQRFGLLVWPDVSSGWHDVDRWPDTKARRAAHSVFERLDGLDPLAVGAHLDDGDMLPYLRFDDGALAEFRQWREKFEARQRSGNLHPALESHFAKYRKLVPTLALICHLADGHSGPIGVADLLRALAWAQYLETHACRAYASVVVPEVTVAKNIIERIRKGDLPGTLTARDIYRKGWGGLVEPDKVHEALRLLVDHDHLAERMVGTAGRTATIYEVNPRALAT